MNATLVQFGALKTGAVFYVGRVPLIKTGKYSARSARHAVLCETVINPKVAVIFRPAEEVTI